MKVISVLLLATGQAVSLRDVFDAYDEESLLEQDKNEDTIDPNGLMAEIAGDDIAREVMLATDGIQDQALVQLQADPVVAKKSEADPEAAKKPINMPYGLDKNPVHAWGSDRHPADSKDHVYGVDRDEHYNTRNGYPHGHTINDEDAEPKFVQLRADPEPATAPATVAKGDATATPAK